MEFSPISQSFSILILKDLTWRLVSDLSKSNYDKRCNQNEQKLLEIEEHTIAFVVTFLSGTINSGSLVVQRPEAFTS